MSENSVLSLPVEAPGQDTPGVNSENAVEDTHRLDTSSATRVQKRKRTSPRDHSILESAYQQNSKPDKEQRATLVQQTELTEKEVQIWFQNRRQNDRRKAKPLQPHELIPHFRNGVPVEAVKQLPTPENSQESLVGGASSAQVLSDQLSPRGPSIKEILNESEAPTSSSPTTSLQKTPNTSAVLFTPPSSLGQSIEGNRGLSQPSSATTVPSSNAPIARKRSHEQMTGNGSQPLPQDESPKDSKSLRRTSSFVRLAVSADGSVKIRVNDEMTPSPPKERPAPPSNMVTPRSSGLARARSDVASTFNFRDVPGSAKGAIGRSRDARTWEFYCDRSARHSLAARAEEEASGSAVGALGLMRSASSKRTLPLTPNAAKHNNMRRTPSSIKGKPGLPRAQSSMARLQSSDGLSEEDSAKRLQSGHYRRSSGTDSDKENWLPGTRHAVHDFRRSQQSTQQRDTIFQGHSGARTEHAHPIPTSLGSKNQVRRPPNGKAKGEDLDCVQGLLSLSQGAWR
ncbi:Homeobox protein yox1 [Lithohypha guttulata]|uniref:Homeobox protein yox1 n=1 Tax=Lithohypha guttulata TaxID=1690604 RepID=UPI002DDF2850|nr:Homeobox protein yox1 [Lithohypha guttulata]